MGSRRRHSRRRRHHHRPYYNRCRLARIPVRNTIRGGFKYSNLLLSGAIMASVTQMVNSEMLAGEVSGPTPLVTNQTKTVPPEQVSKYIYLSAVGLMSTYEMRRRVNSDYAANTPSFITQIPELKQVPIIDKNGNASFVVNVQYDQLFPLLVADLLDRMITWYDSLGLLETGYISMSADPDRPHGPTFIKKELFKAYVSEEGLSNAVVNGYVCISLEGVENVQGRLYVGNYPQLFDIPSDDALNKFINGFMDSIPPMDNDEYSEHLANKSIQLRNEAFNRLASKYALATGMVKDAVANIPNPIPESASKLVSNIIRDINLSGIWSAATAPWANTSDTNATVANDTNTDYATAPIGSNNGWLNNYAKQGQQLVGTVGSTYSNAKNNVMNTFNGYWNKPAEPTNNNGQ